MRVTLAIVSGAAGASLRICEKQSFLATGGKPNVVKYQQNRTKAAAESDSQPIPFDGYFEVGCFVDSTDEKVHTTFKGTAVSPKQCFNFCRDKPEARFFGLAEGRRCYCSPWPTLSTGAGGNGQCTAVCEGDKSKMCGGMTKASIYEMHRCGDITESAEKDRDAAEALIEKWNFNLARWTHVVDDLTAAGKIIDVKDVRQRVMSSATDLEKHRSDTALKVSKLETKVADLQTALDGFSPNGATADDMRKVEEAQDSLLKSTADVQASAAESKKYWDAHSLDGAMKFRSVAGQSISTTDHASDLNFMPKKVRTAVKCDSNPADGCEDFPDELTYVTVGDNIASLYQVYNTTAPIEGRPADLDAAAWKIWAANECHEMCVMTVGCVAGNAIGSTTSEEPHVFAFTCNLKKSVSDVYMSKKNKPEHLITGFIFNSYYDMKSKDIKFHTAEMIVEAQ